MKNVTRWSLGIFIAVMLVGVPAVYYRWAYTEAKRLRVVVPGQVYRSGQMTARGFEDAVRRFGIRTILNLQDEYPDPDLRTSFWNPKTLKESELCRRLNVRYVHLPPNLIDRRRIPAERPEAIDGLLQLLDDPDTYPVLIHCKAGLHRTGVVVSVYRMEYDRWSSNQAIRELKACGFGNYACTAANDYIMQYILTYRPGVRKGNGGDGR